jgi:DNA-binding NtrC family response regulator
LTPCALDLLQSYPWPGNVRQLRNVVRRAGLMTSGEVTAAHIRTCIPKRAGRVTVTSSSPFDTEPATLRDLVDYRVRLLERDAILDALTQAKGNKTIAARRLGIDYKTFRIKLKVIEQHVPVDHDDIAV